MYNTIQKTIAAWAFNHYIAYYYFDNVNVNQLKVAFEKGEVELENLPIKKDALQHFNLPVEVVSGVVGKLSIKVPLLTMLTDSWVIKISDLMLILTSKKQTNSNNNVAPNTNSTASTAEDDSFTSLSPGDQSNLAEYLEKVELEDDVKDSTVNSEETKLAEFYSSFSATVSAIVRDIYKNIRLEIESVTILFEDSDYGLEKFSVDSLLLHRPKSARNLKMDNISIYLSNLGPSCDDLIHIHLESCDLEIHDEASNNMQLVVVGQDQSKPSKTAPPAITSEIKVDGNSSNVSIEQLIRPDRDSRERSTTIENGGRIKDGFIAKRNILKSDTLRIEFKLNNNFDNELHRLTEKNLHIKLDLVGMQYIHSQIIYEMTAQRLMNLLKFFLNLQRKRSTNPLKTTPKISDATRELDEKGGEISLNKLLNINIEDGLIYIVDDTSGLCAIPLLEISLDDCRILQFSAKHQQNGFVFAKIGCSSYNREVSTWDPLLRPWPFHLSWDFETASMIGNRVRRIQHRQISLNSDELADIVLSSAFLDLTDVALKRVVDNFMHPRLWPSATSLCYESQLLSQEFNSIFVIQNETGHKLHFAPLEHSELFELYEPSRLCIDIAGDSNQSASRKISDHSKSSVGSRNSPDLNRWISIDVGETISFEYETLPIYRRHISDLSAQSRVLLVTVEGWKTLLPIPIDKTGLFFREALSDRVRNEDSYIVVSIDLENKSARKIISIRSPLYLVNKLDATLEVHFEDSKQALYIKPDSQLAVPLPYLFDRMHLRPCNVGVIMSEQPLLWDSIQQTLEHDSKVHICYPITVTDLKHVSYCGSHPYRICVATRREGFNRDDLSTSEISLTTPLPVFTVSFISPLTIINLLPCKLQFSIGEIDGTLAKGCQKRIYQVDTTRSINVNFKMEGFPRSKPLNIDPGATGSFRHSLEMFDEFNRSLYLDAEIILASLGEEPAVQVVISAQFWLINNTRLPLIFKQEGATLEAAGQYHEHEETPASILLFSFYDIEIEPPWLCSMRLGKSKGLSMWCEGFKLEKGSGERRLCFVPKDQAGDSKVTKSLIDINIRRGFGKYSGTRIVTLTARYGFNPLTKTPKKLTVQSPHNYKLTSYNHNANLAEKIAGQAVTLFDTPHKGTLDLNLVVPGFSLTLVDNAREKLIEASFNNIAVKCTTKAREQIIDCSVQDIRIDNLLSECEKSVMLDRAISSDESINAKPAIRLLMDRVLGNSFGSVLFKQVQLSMCELVLNIEEKLVLKLVEFMSYKRGGREKNMNNLSQDLERILHPEEDRLSKYYFDLLRIDLASLKLSVYTSANLTQPLQKLKAYLGLKFFGFEDAQVQLAPYFKMNISRTFKGVFDSVTRFYKQQILEQAPRIVGQQIQNYLRFHFSDLLSTLYDEVYNKLFN